ncbi:MAG: ATPase, T2SS/T4P/T4SS family [Phycisphaerae bacterium]|nr:ATPase, T2SS/T4P/T4SS family [Phycisphaerae bacterium]
MDTLSYMLAEVPQQGGYFSLVKWFVLLAAAVGWIAVAQWVDKDTWRLHYKRFTFNGVIVGAGVLGLIVWLLVPYFVVGLLVFVVCVGGSAGVYVILRNQLVPENSRVLTGDHFARLFGRKDASEKVGPSPVLLQTMAHQAVPALPESDPLYEGYVAGQTLLTEAINRRAERVAITPSAKGIGVQYTIDGIVSDGGPIDRRTADLMIAYFKKMAGMDVADRRKPQSGKLTAQEPAQPIDPQILALGYNAPDVLPARSLLLDIRTSGTRAGETMQIQTLDQSELLSFDRLGMTDRQMQLVASFRQSAGGVVVFGCGDKLGTTTTLYQALRAHDAFMSNVQTIEERPEGEIENITQHVYKADGAEEQTFGRQLQSIIRRGPDIVAVSQCKDKETAQLIARSAAENVKFYVEMSGRDTFTLLARWVALVGDLSLAMQPLTLVIAQTLVRRLCTGCREAYRPDPDLLRKINLPADRIEKLYRPPTRVPMDKQGNKIPCPLCQGIGYRGRTGVFEVLVVDDELRRLVVGNASANEIKKYCRTQKMLYLQEEALRKVIAGETSINEVVRIFQESK